MAGFDEGNFLDLLYGAAIEPELWIEVMERFADLIGGSSAFLSQLDVVSGRGSGLIARVDPAMPELYRNHFADKNILSKVANPVTYARHWDTRILTDEDWVPKRTLVGGEYYNDFLKPQDVHSVLMIRLSLRGTVASVLNVHRGRAREQFAGEARATAERLHPHLIRAFRLSERLADERGADADAASVFETSAHALFLVDDDGRLLRHNPAAEVILSAGTELRSARGRLTPRANAEARQLEALIHAAAAPEVERRTGGSMPIARGAGAAPMVLSVSPLPPARTPFASPARMLVSVTDPLREIGFPAARMAEDYGLTRSEVRVAGALFTGANAKETAAKLGLSQHTVHTHIARVFEKTGARRQSELMSLMMRTASLNSH